MTTEETTASKIDVSIAETAARAITMKFKELEERQNELEKRIFDLERQLKQEREQKKLSVKAW
jgi:tetrahydromethanopterin S-methyltransferase subunit B